MELIGSIGRDLIDFIMETESPIPQIFVVPQCINFRISLFGHFIDHGHTFLIEMTAQDIAAVFDDAALFVTDLRQGIAQLFHMVKADRRDDRKSCTLDHIGRIQTSAHADFQNDDIDVLLFEIFTHDQKIHGKHRKIVLVEEFVVLIENIQKCLIGNILIIDADTVQMRIVMR